MTREELDQKLKDLKNEYETRKNLIIRQYCDENNPYGIGYTFTDHIGSIEIEKIQYNYYQNPCCVYIGTILNKDGTPNKRRAKRQAWQSNDVNVK